MSIIPHLKEMPVVTTEQIVRFRNEAIRQISELEDKVIKLEDQVENLGAQLIVLQAGG